MTNIGETYQEAVLEICDALNLPPPSDWQSWERGDAATSEYLNKLVDLMSQMSNTSVKRRIMAELLLGSLDHTLMKGKPIDTAWPRVAEFLVTFSTELSEVLDYWCCADDIPDDRFYISKYVMELKADIQRRRVN